MSSTLSFCCGSGNIETVLLDENNQAPLSTMQFLCRSAKRPQSQLSLEDISQYPLLEGQYDVHHQKEPYSKPKFHTATNPLKVQAPKQQQQQSSSYQKDRTRRPSSLRPTAIIKEKPPTARSSFSVMNKDIAMAWMQMGRIKPLKTSTRHNSRVEVTESSQKNRHRAGFRSSSDETLVGSIPAPRLKRNVHQRFTPVSLLQPKKSSSRHNKPFVPPPPPQISHSRRFRVCFGVMSDWKSAVDPKSGRTYYFNATTKETQWRKPMELASDEERAEMEAKEAKQKAFFASMEANIIKSMAEGTVMKPAVKREPSLKPQRPQIVRTISSMDEGLLRDLVKRTASITRGPAGARSSVRNSALEKIQENSKEFEQSSIDFGNTSVAHMFDGDESSANLGVSMEEIQALKELAQISEDMAIISDDSDMGMSSSDGLGEMSMAQDFSISFGDSLNFSADSLDRTATKKAKESSFSGLIFSPEVGAKKVTTVPADAGEIIFTPDVTADKREPVVPSFGKSAAKPKTDEPDLRSDLKAKPKKFGGPPSTKPNKLVRRNTCGTIYVGTTMSAPDKDATIKCICGVFRAHIIGAEREDEGNGAKYDSTEDRFRLFNDRESQRKAVAPLEEEMCLDELTLDEAEKELPTLEVITSFYRDVFMRAQMETDCIIMSLIYVERLIKVTDGLLRPRRSNWRSLLFSCMILSSKVWDDLSMWNGDFSQTCPAGVIFSVKRINELELAILKALKYKVKVPASEYAKYYFLLRSMLIKSGLGGDDLKTMNPLDVEGAKRLEQVSSSFQNVAATKRRTAQENKLRSKSMGDADRGKLRVGAQKGGASLEHMMQM